MRNKHRNWETVVQILGLRTQILHIKQFSTVKADVELFEFGSAYIGKQRIWSFEFDVEFKDLYGQTHEVLVKDFAQTPIIIDLDETVKFPAPLFYTAGENKNIYFKTLV
jgi:hypothetical protein